MTPFIYAELDYNLNGTITNKIFFLNHRWYPILTYIFSFFLFGSKVKNGFYELTDLFTNWTSLFFRTGQEKKITFCFQFTKIPVQLVEDTVPFSKNTGLVLVNKKNGTVRKKTGPVSKKPGTQYVICHIFAPLVICQRVGIAHTRWSIRLLICYNEKYFIFVMYAWSSCGMTS